MMRGRIVDPTTGKDVAPGAEGEMLLAGPNVMLGYLNRPEANKETLVTDEHGTVWLRTGDIARVDEDGFFYILDRLKELIKVKGFRASAFAATWVVGGRLTNSASFAEVPPAELEATLLECPLVADCAVIGVWNEQQQTEFPRAYSASCKTRMFALIPLLTQLLCASHRSRPVRPGQEAVGRSAGDSRLDEGQGRALQAAEGVRPALVS